MEKPYPLLYLSITAKLYLPLQPYDSFKSSPHLRFSQQIRLINTDIKLHIIAFYSHLINLFACQDIPKINTINNFSHYIILIALNSIRHKIGIYNCKHVFFYNSSRNHRVCVDIIHSEVFHCCFIPISGCRYQCRSVFRKLFSFATCF